MDHPGPRCGLILVTGELVKHSLAWGGVGKRTRYQPARELLAAPGVKEREEFPKSASFDILRGVQKQAGEEMGGKYGGRWKELHLSFAALTRVSGDGLRRRITCHDVKCNLHMSSSPAASPPAAPPRQPPSPRTRPSTMEKFSQFRDRGNTPPRKTPTERTKKN
jgi:hypothetical protein